VLLALVWGGFITVGMGDLRSSLALTSPVHKALHVFFAGLVVACAARAYSVSWAARRVPYGSGNYLFPFGVVSAHESNLVEHDSREMKSASQVGAAILVEFNDGASFTFPVQSAEIAEKTLATFQAHVEKWKEVADGEPLPRARLNPLLESGVPNPLAPTQPHPRPQLLSGAVL
jgi:hypothetical protein